MAVYISICIPAYKRVEYLERLLDSIAIQSYKDFEVIVSDDSPANDVSDLCEKYKDFFLVKYHKNPSSLGTPENWNEAIRRANGTWIKLMHDDDWFSSKESLQIFANAALQNDNKFIFSSYTSMYFPEIRTEAVRPSAVRLKQLVKDPVSLLSKNIIGPPSVSLHRNTGDVFYDKNIKWLVDIDFYNRRLKDECLHHIHELLVHVGMSEEQVTAMCHTNPEVELPENYYFLQKTGIGHLKNILVYDAWWRLLRNFEIKNQQQLEQYVTGKWPDIILLILKDVNKVPASLIKIGAISKFMMTLSYLRNKKKIK